MTSFSSTSPLKLLPIFDAGACTVTASRRDYFDDVDIPDVVSGTDLLPLPATDLNYIDMHHCCQADSSTTMPNALRDMYLLTTALHGM
jgi:hypothetical protein